MVLDIEVDGQPKQIKWLKDGNLIDSNKNAKMEDLGNGHFLLTIPSLNSDDFGNYSVLAINDAGETESKAKITEFGKLKF